MAVPELHGLNQLNLVLSLLEKYFAQTNVSKSMVNHQISHNSFQKAKFIYKKIVKYSKCTTLWDK